MGGWVVDTTARPPCHRERDPVRIVQRVGWAPRPVWTLRLRDSCGRWRTPPSWRLGASYRESDGLTYWNFLLWPGPSASSARFFVGQKLTNDPYILYPFEAEPGCDDWGRDPTCEESWFDSVQGQQMFILSIRAGCVKLTTCRQLVPRLSPGNAWPLKMGPIHCAETSLTLLKIPE